MTAIYNTSGVKVAEYAYDAWGNCTIASETTSYDVANANPIRYRGYYYDSDTGLYYLNARYYSPKWRRFISPDSTDYLDPESVNGLNLYCYCNNDPVNYVDPSGCFVITLSMLLAGIAAGAAIGASIGLASTAYADLKDDGQVFNGSIGWQTYIGGAVGGAITGAGIGLCSVLGAGLGVALSTGTALAIGGTVAATGVVAGGVTVSGGTALALGVGGAFVSGGLGYTARILIAKPEAFEWSDMFIEAGANAMSGLLTFTGAMAGGILGIKVPGAKFSLKNFMLYHLGAAYFGVYSSKALLSYIKSKLKERF